MISTISTPQPGAWVTFPPNATPAEVEDVSVHATELDALRYAVNEGHRCVFVRHGETLGTALDQAKPHDESVHRPYI